MASGRDLLYVLPQRLYLPLEVVDVAILVPAVRDMAWMASSGPPGCHCGSLHLMFWYSEADKAFVTGLICKT